MEIAKFKNYWICAAADGRVIYFTISFNKSESIKRWVSYIDTNWLIKRDWRYWKRRGFKCIKVDVSITEAVNEVI